MIKSFLKNKIVANASWLILGKIIQMLISFVVGVLTARYLGPGNYGLINYAGAYISFFSSFCTLGINSVIVKELLDNKGKNGEVIGTALGLRIASSVLSVMTIVAISTVLDYGEHLTITIVALSSIGVIFNVFEVFNYYFQSRLESKKTAISLLCAYVITAAYKVFLLVTDKSVIYFALATSVDYFCIAVAYVLFYVKSRGERLTFSFKYGKALLSKSYHYILPGLMVSIYAQTDKIMLKQMISETELGYYATAVVLCNMWCFVLSAIIDSMIPPIMESYNQNRETYVRKNKLLYCIVFYVSMMVSVLYTIFGELAISVLYGKEFLPVVNPLRFVTWYTAFSYLGVARNAWIVCENKQKYLKYIYIAAAVSNVLFNVILIPPLGATGASIASLLAQIITVLIAPFLIKPLRENSIMMIEAISFKGLKRR